jgi:hypothetical protein
MKTPLEECKDQLSTRRHYVSSGPYVVSDMSKNALQYQWRVVANRPWDFEECTTAVLDALVNQGGYVVYDGDGVSCVVQMIHAQWKRAEEAEDKLQKVLDDL